MNDYPPCPVSGPPVGCCLVQVPDTSSWQVVCASPSGAAAVVPALTEWGGLLFGILLVVVAFRRLR